MREDCAKWISGILVAVKRAGAFKINTLARYRLRVVLQSAQESLAASARRVIEFLNEVAQMGYVWPELNAFRLLLGAEHGRAFLNTLLILFCHFKNLSSINGEIKSMLLVARSEWY